MENMKEAYLKCKTSEGMFPTEYLARFELYDGRIASGFFNKRCFKDNLLKVFVVEDDKDKKRIAVFSGECLSPLDLIPSNIIVNSKEILYQKD